MTRMLMTVATFLTLTAAQAALAPPLDFAGQWVGTATPRGTTLTEPLALSLAATPNARKFRGSVTLTAGNTTSCHVVARYRTALLLRATCGGKVSVVVAHYDPTTGALTGSFPIGHHHTIADFTLARVG